MPPKPLLLSAEDLRPLIEDAHQMAGAIDTIEKATVHFQQHGVREQNLVDRTQGEGPSNLVEIHFSADDALVTGFQMFAETPGGPSVPNSRFVVLLDPETRQLLSIVDYTSLSPLRVGASAGVGCRYLAPPDARTVGILGSSKQARGQLQAIHTSVPGVERVRVFSPTPEHREAFAREMSDWLVPVEAVITAEAAVRGADIVGLANNSRQPVLDAEWVKDGALVISISGGQLPEAVIDRWRVVSTTWESLASREPYATRVKAGRYGREDVAGELGAVILGEANPRAAAPGTIVFELSRINIWAVAVAHWAYEWALKEGRGTPFTVSGG